ncbi:MAG: hypothetical protein JRG91_04860 [Deltaproteobacteria bacterium]|nr:hypothetical protein [Deltaproteobacteria bacterium]
MITIRTTPALMVCIALAFGCAGGNDPEQDTATEPDAVDDAVDVAEEADAVEDVVDEEVAVSCEGTESLNLEFLDPDDAAIEGVVVVLECGESGTDGTVGFDNLNLSVTPVDFTYIHDGVARTWLDAAGASRSLPDPLSLTLGRADDPPMDTMYGDLVHQAEDTLILVTTEGGGIDLTRDVRYEVGTKAGTGLTLYAIEWSSTGTAGTPLGYQIITYDAPTGGADGPTVGPTTETLSTVDLTLTFNVDPDHSSIMQAWLPTDDPNSNRTIAGARLAGLTAAEDFLFLGLTMNWAGGFSSPTLTVAWIPEGLTAVTDLYPDLWLVDRERNSWAIFRLPDDPSSWTSFTVNDTPRIPGFDMAVIAPFDEIIEVQFPDWTDAFQSYHIRLPESGGALFQDSYSWTVIVHPETESFSFPDLPWPSATGYDEALFPGITHRFGVSSRAYDADPYADYVIYTDDEWGTNHYVGSMADSRYRIEVPD